MVYQLQPDPSWLPEARLLHEAGISTYRIAKLIGITEKVAAYWLFPEKRAARIAEERAARIARRDAKRKAPRIRKERPWLARAKELRSRGNSWAVIGRILKINPETVRYQLVYSKGARNARSQEAPPDQG